MNRQQPLGEIFDRKAFQYRKFRPGYPTAMVEDIIRIAGLKKQCSILEIGCGAGQATPLFSRLDPIQISIDPGENLLAECKANCVGLPNYTFNHCRFEDFVAPPESFDLIYAATCFHWITPELRFFKPHKLLKKNGVLAVFTHRHIKGIDGFFTRVQGVYRQLVPELTWNRNRKSTEAGCAPNPLSLIFTREYDQELTYSADEYVGLLQTFSDHIALGKQRLQKLCREIKELIVGEFEGKIIKTLTVNLQIYRKN